MVKTSCSRDRQNCLQISGSTSCKPQQYIVTDEERDVSTQNTADARRKLQDVCSSVKIEQISDSIAIELFKRMSNPTQQSFAKLNRQVRNLKRGRQLA